MPTPRPEPPTRLTVYGGPKAEPIHIDVPVKPRPVAKPKREPIMNTDHGLIVLLVVIIVAMGAAYVVANAVGTLLR
jgi:hypothetical protein